MIESRAESNMTIDFKALAAPFPAEAVSWRVGSTTQDKSRGLPLAYIDARDVMDRLDEVCGPSNWQRRYPKADAERTICEIGIRIDGEWVWKADGADDTDYEGVKGGLSDAFKRAAVSWGVGRYLYGLASPWVNIQPAGRSFKIDPAEMPRLRALLPTVSGENVKVADTEPDERANKDSRLPFVLPSDKPEGYFDDFIKDVKGKWYWKVTAIQAAGRELSGHVEGCTEMDELLGIQKDYAKAIEAMRLALPKWHEAFVTSFNARAAEIKRREAQFSPDRILG